MAVAAPTGCTASMKAVPVRGNIGTADGFLGTRGDSPNWKPEVPGSAEDRSGYAATPSVRKTLSLPMGCCANVDAAVNGTLVRR